MDLEFRDIGVYRYDYWYLDLVYNYLRHLWIVNHGSGSYFPSSCTFAEEFSFTPFFCSFESSGELRLFQIVKYSLNLLHYFFLLCHYTLHSSKNRVIFNFLEFCVIMVLGMICSLPVLICTRLNPVVKWSLNYISYSFPLFR